MKFIKGFSTLAKPFTNLLKKEGSYIWKDKQQSVFDFLKGKLSSTPMVWFLDFAKPFEMHTNASGFVISMVLM
jgi:hypothetical protein